MKKTNKVIQLRQSKQRTKILELLSKTSIHPTADWLYSKLKKEFPNLSLGTVYRNLSLLSEQGLIKKIQYGSTFDRYEANISQHYHLICEKCGSITDFVMPIYDELNIKANKLTEFYVKNHKIEFYGLCEKCK